MAFLRSLESFSRLFVTDSQLNYPKVIKPTKKEILNIYSFTMRTPERKIFFIKFLQTFVEKEPLVFNLVKNNNIVKTKTSFKGYDRRDRITCA